MRITAYPPSVHIQVGDAGLEAGGRGGVGEGWQILHAANVVREGRPGVLPGGLVVLDALCEVSCHQLAFLGRASTVSRR